MTTTEIWIALGGVLLLLSMVLITTNISPYAKEEPKQTLGEEMQQLSALTFKDLPIEFWFLLIVLGFVFSHRVFEWIRQ